MARSPTFFWFNTRLSRNTIPTNCGPRWGMAFQRKWGVVLAMLALMEQASLFKWLGDVFSICSPFSDQFFSVDYHWLHWLIQERTHRILRISSPELRIEFTTWWIQRKPWLRMWFWHVKKAPLKNWNIMWTSWDISTTGMWNHIFTGCNIQVVVSSTITTNSSWWLDIALYATVPLTW